MITMTRWFERQFDFDLSASLYPNLLARLAGTPARATAFVDSIPAEILTRREDHQWSIQENIGHLLDLEPLWLGRLDDFLAGKDELRPADLSNQKTHKADHNSGSLEDILTEFDGVRKAFVDRLDSLSEADIVRQALHPRLQKPMRLLDLVYFVAEHDDQHLAQVRMLKKQFSQA